MRRWTFTKWGIAAGALLGAIPAVVTVASGGLGTPANPTWIAEVMLVTEVPAGAVIGAGTGFLIDFIRRGAAATRSGSSPNDDQVRPRSTGERRG